MYSVQNQGKFAATPFQSGVGAQRKQETELGEHHVSQAVQEFSFPFRAR